MAEAAGLYAVGSLSDIYARLKEPPDGTRNGCTLATTLPLSDPYRPASRRITSSSGEPWSGDWKATATIGHFMKRLPPLRLSLPKTHWATTGSLLTALASQAALLISGIAIARMLGPENRGYLAFILLVPAALAGLASLGIPAALPFFIAREPGGVTSIIRAISGPAVAQAGVAMGVHVIAITVLFRGAPETVEVAVVVSLLIIPGALAHQYSIAVLQGLRRFRSYNVLRLIPVVIYSAGVGILYVVAGGSVLSITATSVLVTLGAALISAYVVRTRLPEKRGQLAFMPFLGFGLKGFLGATNSIESYRLDQILIGITMQPAALGFYVIGLSFTNLPKFIGQSVGIVAYPHVASQAADGGGWSSMWRYFWLVAALCGLTVLILGLLAEQLIVLLFGAQFRPSAPVTSILLLNALLFSMRRVLTDGVRGLGLSGLGSLAEGTSVVVFLPAAFFLGMWAGIEGVAMALTLSSASALIVLFALVWTRRPVT